MNEQQFRDQAQEQGYGEVRVVEFPPAQQGELHTHEFSAIAMVTEGEFILGLESGATTFTQGQHCQLDAGTVHSESTGAEGATVLVATK